MAAKKNLGTHKHAIRPPIGAAPDRRLASLRSHHGVPHPRRAPNVILITSRGCLSRWCRASYVCDLNHIIGEPHWYRALNVISISLIVGVPPPSSISRAECDRSITLRECLIRAERRMSFGSHHEGASLVPSAVCDLDHITGAPRATACKWGAATSVSTRTIFARLTRA